MFIVHVFGFFENLPLDVVFYNFKYFVLHIKQMGSKYNKDDQIITNNVKNIHEYLLKLSKL